MDYHGADSIVELINEARSINDQDKIGTIIESLSGLQADCMKHLQHTNRLEQLAIESDEADHDKHNRLGEFLTGVGVMLTNEIHELKDRQSIISRKEAA